MSKTYSHELSRQSLLNPCPWATTSRRKKRRGYGRERKKQSSSAQCFSYSVGCPHPRWKELHGSPSVFSNSYILCSPKSRGICPVEILAWYSLCSLWAHIKRHGSSRRGCLPIVLNKQCFGCSFQFSVRAGHGTPPLRSLRQEELKFKASLVCLVNPFPQKY